MAMLMVEGLAGVFLAGNEGVEVEDRAAGAHVLDADPDAVLDRIVGPTWKDPGAPTDHDGRLQVPVT